MGSNTTNSPAKSSSNDMDDSEKPKRTQTCFRCRQSKVKCVFEADRTSCRRCRRLGVNCELQGKREPLSWQMRVQHQLAALEGSLHSFLEKQMIAGSTVDGARSRASFPRSRESITPIGGTGLMVEEAEGGAKKRRRTTIAGEQRYPSDSPQLASAYGHAHTAESPGFAGADSTSASSYPSAHLSPRNPGRGAHHQHEGVGSNGLLASLVASSTAGYANSHKSKSPTTMVEAGGASTHLLPHGTGASLPSDHALADDEPAPASGERGAFDTDDEHDQASRPLSAIQKLRMSVLDRKKEFSRTGERVFPNLYCMATSDVGSKDPRPNVIKQELLSPPDAVVLFRFFAEYLDQYSFGFPTYRPDAIMSPMILTSVVCIASLHHAQLSRLHAPLKKDLIARLQTDDPSFPCSDVYETLFSSASYRSSRHLQSNLHFEKELDPELGIGVEEIVGASLFASWFGGRRAWMASRLARWWSAKFLRQQQSPAMMTMGEIMSILPPPRDLGKQDLLRVWLSAYITEIHQACMEGTKSIAGLSSPHAVCYSLQYSKGSSQRTTLRDRVLIIHSKIAWILSKAYHIAGSGSADWAQGDKAATPKESPSRSSQSYRDGSITEGITSTAVPGGGGDAAACLQAVLDAFEELETCQEEMVGCLDAESYGESESMLYLDLFLAKVLIASIGCDFLDSTLWDGSLGQLSAQIRGKDKSSAEADLQRLRGRTLRESLTRGVEGGLRSLELICLPTLSSAGGGPNSSDRRGPREVSLNVPVLPLWFHWVSSSSMSSFSLSSRGFMVTGTTREN